MRRLSTGVRAAVVCCVPPPIHAGWRIVGGGPLVAGGWLLREISLPPPRLGEDGATMPMTSATRTCIGKRRPDASARTASDGSIRVSLSLEAPPTVEGRANRRILATSGCIAPRFASCSYGAMFGGTASHRDQPIRRTLMARREPIQG